MINKFEFDDLDYLKKLPTNISKVNLVNGVSEKTSVNIIPKVIKNVSNLFVKDLLLYFENGGTIENLNAQNLYKEK